MKVKKELVAQTNPKSPISETFRTLRTNLQFMNSNKSVKTILVTSTMPDEGKSWVASNLAVSFAQSEKKVLLIDADMRKGRLKNIFVIIPTLGLSNYLSGINETGLSKADDITEYIRKTEVENLYLISAGNIPPNPSELLGQEKTIEMLDELKKFFDVIILDGTPSLLVTDAIILARIADSTLIVAEHKITKKDNLAKIKKNIENVGGNIAGVVLNKVPINISKYNSTYYYSSTEMVTKKSSKHSLERIIDDSKNLDKENIPEKKEILDEINEYLKNNDQK